MKPEVALAIAREAHCGQTDKAGRPYIGHPIRVAEKLDDPDAKVVALLHDVLEDTPLTADDLLRAGITDRQLEAIETLTHPENVDDATYWQAIRSHPLARIVKIADIADNTDPLRHAQLDPPTRERLVEKYRRALTVLLDQTSDPANILDPTTVARLLGPSMVTLDDAFGSSHTGPTTRRPDQS